MSDFFMNKSSDDWNKLKHLVDLSAENARLKAEVELLRKAGDAMASALILFEMKSEEERQDRIKAWSAAKEGKQP